VNLTVYLAHPISGLSYDEVMDYYSRMEKYLQRLGYDTLCPMRGKAYLRNEKELRPGGYQQPVSTNHAIVERDAWMVRKADIILADLVGARSVSIGCMMELAWAHLLGKHTLVILEEENPHRHAFILESADIVFDNQEACMVYMEDLVGYVPRR